MLLSSNARFRIWSLILIYELVIWTLSYNYRTNIMSSRVRTTAWLSFHHAQFQLNLAVLAHYWPKQKKVQNSFSKFYYRQPGWIRTDEVNRDRGGESRNGAWAGRDTDKMSLSAWARRPDSPRLSQSTPVAGILLLITVNRGELGQTVWIRTGRAL